MYFSLSCCQKSLRAGDLRRKEIEKRTLLHFEKKPGKEGAIVMTAKLIILIILMDGPHSVDVLYLAPLIHKNSEIE